MTTTVQRLNRLGELLDLAKNTTNPEIAASYIAQIQRLSGHALRTAVGDCIEAGQTDWRWLATCTQTPPGTLRQQYELGGRVVIHDPLAPTEPNYDVTVPDLGIKEER